MSDIIHDEIKSLLAAYEHDLLTPDEVTRLESHLYECDSCFLDAASSSDAATLLRHSQTVREKIEELAGPEDISPASDSTQKSSTGYIKYLLAAVVVLVVAIPSIMFLPREDMQVPNQKIMLLPMRSNGQTTIDANIEGPVEIVFASEEFATVGSVDVRIVDKDDQIVYDDEAFDRFNDMGAGSLLIDSKQFSVGQYRLEVRTQADGPPLRIYYFKVK